MRRQDRRPPPRAAADIASTSRPASRSRNTRARRSIEYDAIDTSPRKRLKIYNFSLALDNSCFEWARWGAGGRDTKLDLIPDRRPDERTALTEHDDERAPVGRARVHPDCSLVTEFAADLEQAGVHQPAVRTRGQSPLRAKVVDDVQGGPAVKGVVKIEIRFRRPPVPNNGNVLLNRRSTMVRRGSNSVHAPPTAP